MQLQVRSGARRTTAALSLLIPASSPLFPSRSSPVTSRYLPPSLPPSLGASRQASVPPPRPFPRRPRTAPSPPPSASHQVSSALSAVGCAPLQGGLRGSSLVRQARPRRSRLCRGALAARLAALPPLSHLSLHSSAAAPQARVAATSSRVGADGRRGGQRRRRRPAAASTPPPPPSLSTSFDGMRRLAGRVQSSSGGAAAAGADGAVAAPLIGEPALPRGAPAAGGVFRRCGGRCRREGRAHGGGGAALTAADGGGEGPSAGRRSVAAIAVACRLAGPASGPRRSGLPALHGASRNSRRPPPLAPPPALSLGPASRPARDSPHAASPPPASHPRPRHLGPSAREPARVPAADWRGDKAIEAEHMRWRRRPRLARDRRLAPLGSATIRGAPASARSRLPRTHPSRRRLLPPSPTLPLRPPPPLPRGAAPPLPPQPSRPSPLRAVTVTATVTVTVSPSRLSPCPSPRRPLHGARQRRRRDASALAPPPPHHR